MEFFKPGDFDKAGDGPLRKPAHEIANEMLNDHLGNEFAIVCHFKTENEKLANALAETEAMNRAATMVLAKAREEIDKLKTELDKSKRGLALSD